MQTAALSSVPFLLPARAAREVWPNGVVHTDDGPTDVYELPTTVPGVAKRIEVRPVLWGLLGQDVVVTDCQGKRLEGTREARGEGWHKQLIAHDPSSGLETVLDPRRHTLSVTTPEVREKTETSSHTFRTTYHREARQEVDAEGNCRLQTNLHGESESMLYSMVREMPPNQSIVTSDRKTWEETRIEKGQPPVTHAWEGGQHSRREGARLESALDGQGRLTVLGDDGVSRSYEMFLRVQ